MQEIAQGTLVLDPTTQEHVRLVLDGELDISRFSILKEANPSLEPSLYQRIENQTRILNILNLTFKALREPRIVQRAREHLGEPGMMLHIPAEDPSCSYVDAVLQKGRLLLPTEYSTSLTSFQGLNLLFQQAALSQDQEAIERVVDRMIATIPNKALVLARMYEYPYERVLNETMESSGTVQLVSVEEFADYVASKVPELQVRGECSLLLSRELLPMDHILSYAELQRTPEIRMEHARMIMDTAPKYHFVYNNNLTSKAFYEAYPERFDMEEIARPMVKWKCEGECMGCPNWKQSLTKAGPHYGHM